MAKKKAEEKTGAEPVERTTFDIPVNTKKKLKYLALMRGVSMKDLLIEGFELLIQKDKNLIPPNLK
jgi:hypothetical protein